MHKATLRLRLLTQNTGLANNIIWRVHIPPLPVRLKKREQLHKHFTLAQHQHKNKTSQTTNINPSLTRVHIENLEQFLSQGKNLEKLLSQEKLY
jgi:transcriptional regulator with AAA-type ATPase domain